MCYIIDWGFHIIAMGLITTRGWACNARAQPVIIAMIMIVIWGQNSVINNECTEKDSQMYFLIYI